MHSPPYPNAHLFIHPAWHLQCTGPQWAGRRIKAFTSISETGYTGSMKKAFKEGLIKAAATTGAWIITGGTNTGVMRLVGEAVAEKYPKYPADTKLTVLGIATWEVIAMRDKLMREDSVRYELIKVGRAFLLGKWGK